MIKEVRRAIMITSKLSYKFQKTKMNNQEIIIENNAIYVLHLFAGQDSNIFSSLDLRLIADNK